MKVDMAYQPDNRTAAAYYMVEKTIAVTLKDVSRFEDLLNALLDAGANHIYDVEFTTSELRQHRDEARALAAKAAIEKARDLAATAGMRLVEKPVGISSSNYGGGSWYGRYRNGGFYTQNVVQNAGGSGDSSGAVALPPRLAVSPSNPRFRSAAHRSTGGSAPPSPGFDCAGPRTGSPPPPSAPSSSRRAAAHLRCRIFPERFRG
jgi:Protein of unknown function (DUF541)